MAVYELDRYATAFYGEETPPQLTVERFEARPTLNKNLLLRWTLPGGDWDQFQLVRNFYGYARDIDDGVTLLTQDANTGLVELVDRGQSVEGEPEGDPKLPFGTFVYYTILLRTPGDVWVRAGRAMGLVPNDVDYRETLYDLLPGYWRELDQGTTTRYIQRSLDGRMIPDPSKVTDAPLYRFLKLMGYELDHIRTEYDLLTRLRNVETMHGELLSYQLQDLGAYASIAMGMVQSRKLLRDIVYLHKIKGTTPAVSGAVEAYTSWPAVTSVSDRNILVEGDFVLWSGGNRSTYYYNAQAEESGETQAPYIEVNTAAIYNQGIYGDAVYNRTDPSSPPPPEDIASVNLVGPAIDGTITTYQLFGGDTVLSVQDTSDLHTLRKQAIPIEESTDYYFSIEVARNSATTWATVELQIQWFEEDGTFISQSSENLTANTSVRAQWTRLRTQQTSPANAVFAVLGVHLDAVVDAEAILRFPLLSTKLDSTYIHPREAIIRVTPDRVNLVSNPSFELDIVGWSAFNATTLAQSAINEGLYNRYALTATSSGGNMSFGTRIGAGADIDIVPERTYSASVYLKGPARNARLSIAWIREDGVTFNTDVGEWSTVGDWSRHTFVGTSPAGAARASLQVEIADTSNGEEFLIDGALFESGVTVREYFDGNRIGNNYFWLGLSNRSQSAYFQNTREKQVRLVEMLRRYLPPDRTFSVEMGTAAFVLRSRLPVTPLPTTSDLSGDGTFGAVIPGTVPFGHVGPFTSNAISGVGGTDVSATVSVSSFETLSVAVSDTSTIVENTQLDSNDSLSVGISSTSTATDVTTTANSVTWDGTASTWDGTNVSYNV